MAAQLLRQIFITLTLVVLTLPAFAQTDDALPANLPDPIYTKLEFPQKTFAGKNTLSFVLDADSDRCKRQYGEDRWYIGCYRNLGLDGKKITGGVAIDPPVKGEWRFSGDYGATFTPGAYWQAGQQYQITMDLDAMGVPPHVLIDGGKRKKSVSIRSADLSLTIREMKYMQDPENPDRKLVSANIRSNYPYEPESFAKNIALKIEEGDGDKLRTRDGGRNFKVEHNANKDDAWLEIPLKTLPDAEQFLRLTVAPGVQPAHGGVPSAKAATERARIPTLTSYLTLEEPSVEIGRQEDGTPEQRLSFSMNMKARPGDVHKQIKLYLLPEKHPVTARQKINPEEPEKQDRLYEWEAANEITPEILQQSESLPLQPMETDSEYSTAFAYPVVGPAKRYVYLEVGADTEAFGGYRLGRPYRTVFRIPEWPHDLRIMQDGSILTLSGARKLSLHARGTDRLNVDVAHIRTEALQHFISQTYGDIRESAFENWNFGAADIARLDTREIPMNFVSPQESQYTALDFSPYIQDGRKGLFLVNIQGHRGKDVVGRVEQRFVLVTDMGLVVKQSRRNTRDVYLMSFKAGAPVAGADIAVLGRNGLPVFTGKTDENGHAAIPALDDKSADRLPVAIVAEKDGDYTFIPYDRGDRVLNMSQFDIGGASIPDEGITAFMFTDRGIYRPGETAQIGIVVRNADWAAMPPALPLKVRVVDPRFRTVSEKIVNIPAHGLAEFAVPTAESGATGTYRAYLSIPDENDSGTSLGSTSFRVEDFQPDRLKIKTSFTPAESRGWISPDGLGASIALTNLYGTPASDRRITGNVTLHPAELLFPGFDGYKFYDSYQAAPRVIEYELPETKTDKDGKATLALKIEEQERKTYSLNLETRGFESGSGRGVTAYSTALVSPMDYVIGYRTDANLGYLRMNQNYSVNLLALDPALQKTGKGNLKLTLVRKTFVSSLVRRGDGSYTYESVPREEDISTADFTIESAGTTLPLPADQPGHFIYRITESGGLKVAEIAFAVAGEGDATGKDREAVLDLRINKERYAPGEDIELSITAPYTGAGLITLESDGVIAQKWFRTDKTDTIETIAVPASFSGKGYVSVAFVRDINSKEIYLNPLSYAAVPFVANLENRTVSIELSVPETVRPGAPVTVSYKGTANGKAVIYAIDEGILQVARYKTPDPVDFFLLNRTLQVRTSQMLDLLMPEYDLVRELSATGGDGAAEEAALGKHLNPFKRKTLAPAIYWSGIVDLDTTEKTVTFTPPGHFNGQMRVMAVAVSDSGVGSASRDMNVRGPVVVTPNLPLFMAPGDTATASVTVANNTGTDGAIALSYAATPGVTAVDAPSSVEISDGTEKTVSFKVKATDHPGAASLTITAALGESRQDAETTLSVRPPVARETTLTTGYADKGRASIAPGRAMYPQLATRTLALSALPTAYIYGLSRYLDEFPYGCTEQIVSQTLPDLSLAAQPEFASLAEGLDAAVSSTVDQLRLRQTSYGGFSLWGGGDTPDLFATVYALDFLVTAMEKDYPVPAPLVESALRYLRDEVNTSITSFDDATLKAYGIYVLTRSGIVTSNEILYLLNYFEGEKNEEWKTGLPALYIAASYKMMRQSELAGKTIDAFARGQSARDMTYRAIDWEKPWTNPFVRQARYISILSRHFPQRAQKIDQETIFALAAFIKEQRYNTLSASYAIQALTDYMAVAGKELAQAGFEIEIDGKDAAYAPNMPVAVDAREIDIRAGKRKPFFYTLTDSGFSRPAKEEAVARNMEVTRVYLDAEGKPLAAPVKVGDVILAEVTLRAHSAAVENVAVVDLIPGGFELDGASGEDGSTMATAFIDRREDRLIAFGTALTEPRTVRYRLRAVSGGTFAVPAPFAEAMYDVTTRARGDAGEITVVDTP